ncbi:MAG TPA: hypothetical protein VKQ72_13380 [Aggregatilineales bacterium]|nr:hypothetical protein [Aggregatilineales bacterium]
MNYTELHDSKSAPSAREELEQARILLETLQTKMRRVVEDFAKGEINRTQFHSLYERYQRQMTQALQLMAEPADLKLILSESGGEDTFHIKKRLTAKVLGVSIYNNLSGTPVETIGQFIVDPALLVPMLSSYRAAARELFKAGVRSTAMENDQYLCFVPGHYTTLIALFSVEPASVQVRTVERMHQDFEDANKSALEKGNIDPSALAYPFLAFMRQEHHKRQTKEVPPADIKTGPSGESAS